MAYHIERVDERRGEEGPAPHLFTIPYRPMAAIHYDYPRVFVLRVMTHTEYDADRWKEEL